MSPASDFYKKLALDCSSQQIAVDLFAFGSQFMDLSTICRSKFNTGRGEMKVGEGGRKGRDKGMAMGIGRLG